MVKKNKKWRVWQFDRCQKLCLLLEKKFECVAVNRQMTAVENFRDHALWWTDVRIPKSGS